MRFIFTHPLLLHHVAMDKKSPHVKYKVQIRNLSLPFHKSIHFLNFDLIIADTFSLNKIFNIEFSICQVKNRIFYIVFSMVLKTFPEILSEFLKENNLTQGQFAQKIGVKQSQVSEWLKGKAKPGYDTLQQMSTAFNVSADYFLGLIDTF